MDHKAEQLIDQLLDDNLSTDKLLVLEKELQHFPEEYEAYLRFREDYSLVFGPADIPDNPYFMSKVKLRIQKGIRAFPVSKKYTWVPYAAIISFGIMSGVFLGNQVEINDTDEDPEITDNFIISDYELDEAYLIGYESE